MQHLIDVGYVLYKEFEGVTYYHSYGYFCNPRDNNVLPLTTFIGEANIFERKEQAQKALENFHEYQIEKIYFCRANKEEEIS